jgi:uncharacterized protein (TIGR02466 family)
LVGSDLKLSNIFPTPVWTIKNDLSEQEIQELEKFSREVVQTQPNLDISSKRGGGGSSKVLTIAHPVLMPIIERCTSALIKDYESVTKLKLLNYWVNVNPPGSYMIPHIHPRSVFACTLYVKTPPRSGKITFVNPNLAARQHFYSAKDAEYNYKSYSFQPVPGMFIAFPSWLDHGVEENLSEEDRISISFNLIADDI